MINLERLKVVGFDLDQTLYPKSPAVDEAIQVEIYVGLAKFLGCGVARAAELFRESYVATGSGSEALVQHGMSKDAARELVQHGLDTADLSDVLQYDPATERLLRAVNARFSSPDLITGSHELNTRKKLQKLRIAQFFGHCIFGDSQDPNGRELSKSDGSAFAFWLELYSSQELKPDQFLYIGDRIKTDHTVPSEMGIQTLLVNTDDIDLSNYPPRVRRLKELLMVLGVDS